MIHMAMCNLRVKISTAEHKFIFHKKHEWFFIIYIFDSILRILLFFY